jgi:hypothetical protein
MNRHTRAREVGGAQTHEAQLKLKPACGGRAHGTVC